MYGQRLSVFSKISLDLRKRINWQLKGDVQAYGNLKKKSNISFKNYLRSCLISMNKEYSY